MALFIKHTHSSTNEGLDFHLPRRALMSPSCNWRGLLTGLSSVNTVRLRSPGSLQMDPGQEIRSLDPPPHLSVSVPTPAQIGLEDESAPRNWAAFGGPAVPRQV